MHIIFAYFLLLQYTRLKNYVCYYYYIIIIDISKKRQVGSINQRGTCSF